MPDPALGPALVVICAQRDWSLSSDTDVLEQMIGSTAQYPSGQVLLHEDAFGELARANHVSAIVMLDYVRGASNLVYGCAVLMNPWAYYPIEPGWFPHSHVLRSEDGEFSWLRGTPSASTFPNGARIAPLLVRRIHSLQCASESIRAIVTPRGRGTRRTERASPSSTATASRSAAGASTRIG